MKKTFNRFKQFMNNIYTSGLYEKYGAEIRQKVILINIVSTITLFFILTFAITYAEYTTLQWTMQISTGALILFTFFYFLINFIVK